MAGLHECTMMRLGTTSQTKMSHLPGLEKNKTSSCTGRLVFCKRVGWPRFGMAATRPLLAVCVAAAVAAAGAFAPAPAARLSPALARSRAAPVGLFSKTPRSTGAMRACGDAGLTEPTACVRAVRAAACGAVFTCPCSAALSASMKVEDLSLTPELAKLTRQVLVRERARTEEGAAIRCAKCAHRMDAASVTGVPGVA